MTVTLPDATGQSFWMAYQDGGGAWQTLQALPGPMTFNITDSRGHYGVAVVSYDSHGIDGDIYHFTRSEVTALDLPRRSSLGIPSVRGILSGVAAADTSPVSSSSHAIRLAAGATSYYLRAPSTSTDLIAVRNPEGGAADRLVVTRDFILNGATTLPTFDFSTQGIQLAPTFISQSGSAPGESLLTYAKWMTRSGASVVLGHSYTNSAALNTVPGPHGRRGFPHGRGQRPRLQLRHGCLRRASGRSHRQVRR